MADWDETSPGDSSVISNYPSNARAARAAVKTNFGVDHVETDGATVGYHDKVTLVETTDPTAVANAGLLYAKDDGGDTEFYYRDDSGNIVQLTRDGALNAFLSGVTTASSARTALGLVIGTDVQAYDADLAAIAALAKTDGNFIVGNGSAWVAESGATARASMGANDAANLTTGTIPNARIQASGVTQHQASLALNATQVATTRSTSTTLVARQMHAITSGATVNSGTAGEWVAIYNNSASAITLTQGSGVTLRLAGTATTGNRTLATRGMCVVYYNTATDVIVSGSGVS